MYSKYSVKCSTVEEKASIFGILCTIINITLKVYFFIFILKETMISF